MAKCENAFSKKAFSVTQDVCSLLLEDCVGDLPKTTKELEALFQRIHGHTLKLIKYQKNFSIVRKYLVSDATQRISRCEKLRNVFQEAGHLLQPIVVKEDHGLGLVSQSKILEDDLLMKIPLNECITEEHAYNAELGKFFKTNPLTSSMANVVLALFILHELSRSQESQWNLYLTSLPQEVNAAVMRVRPEQLIYLRGSSAHEKVVRLYRSICRQYCLLFNCFKAGSDEIENGHILQFSKAFTFEDYRWAVSIVMSRNNPLPSQGSLSGEGEHSTSTQLALIPLIDMMNHKFGKFSCDFDDKEKCVQFYAMESIETGEAICMHYGPRTNLDYFLYCGFVPENNPYNRLQLTLLLNRRDPLYQQKQDILSTLSLDRPTSYILQNVKNGIISPGCFAFARIFVMTGDELKTFLSATHGDNSMVLKHTSPFVDFIGDANLEKRALQYLHGRFTLLERVLMVTNEENAFEDIVLNCIQFTRQERTLLSAARLEVEQILSTFN